jgi:hypothetical protein
MSPRHSFFRFSDKNSLFERGSIGVKGLCVKKNKSQYMGVLGYPVERGIVRDARAGEAGLRGG